MTIRHIISAGVIALRPDCTCAIPETRFHRQSQRDRHQALHRVLVACTPCQVGCHGAPTLLLETATEPSSTSGKRAVLPGAAFLGRFQTAYTMQGGVGALGLVARLF